MKSRRILNECVESEKEFYEKMIGFSGLFGNEYYDYIELLSESRYSTNYPILGAFLKYMLRHPKLGFDNRHEAVEALLDHYSNIDFTPVIKDAMPYMIKNKWFFYTDFLKRYNLSKRKLMGITKASEREYVRMSVRSLMEGVSNRISLEKEEIEKEVVKGVSTWNRHGTRHSRGKPNKGKLPEYLLNRFFTHNIVKDFKGDPPKKI